jgi:hypothetical protein
MSCGKPVKGFRRLEAPGCRPPHTPPFFSFNPPASAPWKLPRRVARARLQPMRGSRSRWILDRETTKPDRSKSALAVGRFDHPLDTPRADPSSRCASSQPSPRRPRHSSPRLGAKRIHRHCAKAMARRNADNPGAAPATPRNPDRGPRGVITGRMPRTRALAASPYRSSMRSPSERVERKTWLGEGTQCPYGDRRTPVGPTASSSTRATGAGRNASERTSARGLNEKSYWVKHSRQRHTDRE